MPTSEQNLRSLKHWLTTLNDTDLAVSARGYAALSAEERAQWEVPGVDAWADRELPSLTDITGHLQSLSLPGLKRLEDHLQQRFQLVKKELRRRRKKGHPARRDPMWIASSYYYELKKRGLTDEAKKFRTNLNVHMRTLKRYLDNPHRDEQ